MVMFSATWPFVVHRLSQEFMDPNPVRVVVGLEDLAANHDVMQIVEVLDDRSRDTHLVSLLEKYHASQRLWLMHGTFHLPALDSLTDMVIYVTPPPSFLIYILIVI